MDGNRATDFQSWRVSVLKLAQPQYVARANTAGSLWDVLFDVVLFVLSPGIHKSVYVWKDTSMTATMLLQDSMLKPSVFRSASEMQTVTHHVINRFVYICGLLLLRKKRNVWFCSSLSSAFFRHAGTSENYKNTYNVFVELIKRLRISNTESKLFC